MLAYHGTTVMFISFVDSWRARACAHVRQTCIWAELCVIYMSYLICDSYFSWVVLTHVHMVCIHVIHMCQYTNPLITLSFICLHDDDDISQYTYYHYDVHGFAWHHRALTYVWRTHAGARTRHATWVEGLTSVSRALVSCTFLIRKVQPRCIAPILLISLYNGLIT